MGSRTPKTCKDSPKPQRINNMGTTRNNQGKDRTVTTTAQPAKEILSEEKQILKQVNKYELSTKFMGGNTKLFAKNWKKLTSD